MMPNTEHETISPTPSEALHVFMKGAPLSIFGSGLLAVIAGFPTIGAYAMAAAIVLWILRAAIVGPVLTIILGKRRQKAAWARHKSGL